MKPSSLPVRVSVVNAEAVVAIFGRFDLHDADLRAVRLTIGADGSPMLEAEFVMPGEFALATGAADRGIDYRVTVRCTDVTDMALADFAEQNVVAEYAFEVTEADAGDTRTVRVVLTCSPGCDLELRCRSVAVTSVQAVPA
jgi:hypothetical protein